MNVISIRTRKRLTKEEQFKARHRRRNQLRALLFSSPWEAYEEYDFDRLLRGEINRYVKRQLLPRVVADLSFVSEYAPRFHVILEAQKSAARLEGEHDVKKRKRKYNDVVRRAIMYASQDKQALGQMEHAIFGEVRYGVPTN